jgi:thimet oligopeptidase
VLQLAEQAATRERLWRAKTDEGGSANLRLLAEITRLRQDYARLFGAASWAEFVIRRRMAGTPQRVEAFLGDVKAAVQDRELRELAELRQAKAAHLGRPLDQVRLDRWDTSFYTERVRQARYSVDQEAFRQHFPPQQSLQFALRLVERLMGVRYQRVEGAAAWHPEVQTYAVSDAASGAALGTLWVDLYPREGKYNHAAVWPLRSTSAALGRQPQSALVVNFDRKGLTLDEMETLLHELGHAVHNNLSNARFVQQAGTHVLRDFVEAPSQMLEDWVYDPRVLALMAEVCPDCKPVPDALLAQAVAARRFSQGVLQSRQHLYASYDVALYGARLQDPLALWAQMEGATPLGHVAGSKFPAGFAHIAGNYSAGYYGYLWSLVVATDLRTAFAADKLDAAVGRRYRDQVLAPGSQRPPQDLVRSFLGREFNARAFYDELAR